MKRLQALTVALFLASLMPVACQRDSPSEPDSRDSLSVSNVDPPGGTRLAPGGAVTFTVQVDYELRSGSFLTGDDGTLTLAVEDQDGRDLDAEVRKTVGHGRGSTSLSDRVVVPAAGVSQVRLAVTLIPRAINAPNLVSVAATYPVAR